MGLNTHTSSTGAWKSEGVGYATPGRPVPTAGVDVRYVIFDAATGAECGAVKSGRYTDAQASAHMDQSPARGGGCGRLLASVQDKRARNDAQAKARGLARQNCREYKVRREVRDVADCSWQSPQPCTPQPNLQDAEAVLNSYARGNGPSAHQVVGAAVDVLRARHPGQKVYFQERRTTQGKRFVISLGGGTWLSLEGGRTNMATVASRAAAQLGYARR